MRSSKTIYAKKAFIEQIIQKNQEQNNEEARSLTKWVELWSKSPHNPYSIYNCGD